MGYSREFILTIKKQQQQQLLKQKNEAKSDFENFSSKRRERQNKANERRIEIVVSKRVLCRDEKETETELSSTFFLASRGPNMTPDPPTLS